MATNQSEPMIAHHGGYGSPTGSTTTVNTVVENRPGPSHVLQPTASELGSDVAILEVNVNEADRNFTIESDLLTQRSAVASVIENVRSPCDLDGLADQCEHNSDTVDKLVGNALTCPMCEADKYLSDRKGRQAELLEEVSELRHDRDRFNQECLLQQSKIKALSGEIRALRKKVILNKAPKNVATLTDQVIELEAANHELKQKLESAQKQATDNTDRYEKCKAKLDKAHSVIKSLHGENSEFRTFLQHMDGKFEGEAPMFHLLMNMIKQLEFNSAMLQTLYKQQKPEDVIHYRVTDGQVIGRWFESQRGATPCDMRTRTKFNIHDLKPYSLIYQGKPKPNRVTDIWRQEPAAFADGIQDGLMAFNKSMLEAARKVNAAANKVTPHGQRARYRERQFAGVSVDGRTTENWDDYDENRDKISPFLRPPPAKGRNPLYRREAREVEQRPHGQRQVVDEAQQPRRTQSQPPPKRAHSRGRNRSRNNRSKSRSKSRHGPKPSATVTSGALER